MEAEEEGAIRPAERMRPGRQVGGWSCPDDRAEEGDAARTAVRRDERVEEGSLRAEGGGGRPGRQGGRGRNRGGRGRSSGPDGRAEGA